VPLAEKEEAKKFKAYQPGYLHFDVTYMPKFNKIGSYLFPDLSTFKPSYF
jgi:hypothetical protein